MISIMLDAGHYGRYNRSPDVPEYYESEVMWKFHLILKEELENFGFYVGTTRKSLYEDLGTFERGQKAKGYDAFISLHSNGCNDPSVDYVAVYYPYDGRNNSFTLAKSLSQAVAQVMKASKGVARTRESKDYPGTEYYGVLRGASKAKCPLYFIIEHSFHTYKVAAEWMLSESNLRALAKAEAVKIAEFYGIETVIFEDGDVNGDGKVNAADYTLLKKHVMGTRELTEDEKERADVNGDGRINTADYVSLKKDIMGK